jgi:glycosyltransferase involved in cell wall biosynthesis
LRYTVSVIATVKNEGQSMRRLLDSFVTQTRSPDEVVIVDGGSTDETLDILREYAEAGHLPLRMLIREGSNIAEGRNAAIAAAQGQIIATTDAGVVLEPIWLEELLRPFEEDEDVDVVGGFFVTDPQTTFEIAMGVTVLPVLSDIDPARFLPSSRSVAYKKEAWASLEGYPEWLGYSEDVLFDLALRFRGYRFAFAPAAKVRFRPRSNLRAFWRQYRNYAMGDGVALLWTERHLIRYGTYVVALPLLLALALTHHPLWWLALALGAILYTRSPYRRLQPYLAGLPWSQKALALSLVPVIRVTGDLAKMAGYPLGLPQGLRNRARIEAYLGPNAPLRGIFPFRS